MNKKFLMIAGLAFAIWPIYATAAQVVTTEASAIDKATETLRTYKLTSIAPKCLSYAVDRKSKFYEVDIREVHNKACGGDPEVAPEVNTMRVARSNGAVSIYDVMQDAYLPAAKYRPGE